MSGTSKNTTIQGRPMILKMDENSDHRRQSKNNIQKHQIMQPKILVKAPALGNRDNVGNSNMPVQISRRLDDMPSNPVNLVTTQEILQMKSAKRLVHSHNQLVTRCFDNIDPDNTDFLVVGVIGMKDVGKSTILNTLVHKNYLQSQRDNIPAENSTFKIDNQVSTDGSTIDMFITTDRLILLDTSALCYNPQRRDFMVNETEDIKQLILLQKTCHVIICVYDDYHCINLLRLLITAESMIQHQQLNHHPTILFVKNRTGPGPELEPPMTEIYEKMFTGSKLKYLTETFIEIPEVNPIMNPSIIPAPPPKAQINQLSIPDIANRSVRLSNEIDATIKDFRERILMMERNKRITPDMEPFTEKKWAQLFSTTIDQCKTDYFLRRYENLRERFHQQVDGN